MSARGRFCRAVGFASPARRTTCFIAPPRTPAVQIGEHHDAPAAPSLRLRRDRHACRRDAGGGRLLPANHPQLRLRAGDCAGAACGGSGDVCGEPGPGLFRSRRLRHPAQLDRGRSGRADRLSVCRLRGAVHRAAPLSITAPRFVPAATCARRCASWAAPLRRTGRGRCRSLAAETHRSPRGC